MGRWQKEYWDIALPARMNKNRRNTTRPAVFRIQRLNRNDSL